MSFFEFLKAKDFVKPMTPAQIAALRQHVQTVNCSNCGAPIDLAESAACGHCGSPLSMLDLRHAEVVVRQLRAASDRPIDPVLPLNLARARADVEAALGGLPGQREWYADVQASGLVGAGLHVIAGWLSPES